ncbi:MAG: ABC transporter ATP-binding protein [Candidatus Riflebacteria bacterium]|nr:ABC transporter ATP-binding protein [Candidatus Riflebacteria bacterium]
MNNLNLSFQQGKINLIVGPSGSGKTTLLLTIAGFLQPLSGKLCFTDSKNQASDHTETSLAFQNPEKMFFLGSAGEEITFGLTENGTDKQEAIIIGREWLNKWGLNPDIFWNKNPFHLSGGEKRRLALAASTVLKPDLILLDEPLAGLDASGQMSMAETISELAESRIVIVVTHDLEALIEVSSAIFLTGNNEIRAFSNPQSFLECVLKEPELYPLPKWYQDITTHFTKETPLPFPSVSSVVKYFEIASPDV